MRIIILFSTPCDLLYLFLNNFVCQAILHNFIYPDKPEGSQVIVGSMNMGIWDIYPTLPVIELNTCSVSSDILFRCTGEISTLNSGWCRRVVTSWWIFVTIWGQHYDVTNCTVYCNISWFVTWREHLPSQYLVLWLHLRTAGPGGIWQLVHTPGQPAVMSFVDHSIHRWIDSLMIRIDSWVDRLVDSSECVSNSIHRRFELLWYFVVKSICRWFDS